MLINESFRKYIIYDMDLKNMKDGFGDRLY